jgi:F-type H+-transporting ATPase subunit b
MKRLILSLAFALAIATAPGFAQEGGHEKKEAAHEQKDEGGLEIWKWVNFLILAGGLGYLIGKHAGPFFAARSAAIRKDLEQSLKQRQEAEARVAEVERRLATLESQIADLRAESERELKAGAERIAGQTADDLAKIRTQGELEIASAGKQARATLKHYAADLALGLAEQKVRAGMTPAVEEDLVDSFVRDLK